MDDRPVQQGDLGVEDAVQDPPGHLLGVLGDDPRQDDQERVGLVTAHAIVRAALLADALGGDDQHVVADVLPVALVDRLEVVDIQGDQAERGLCAAGPLQLAARELDEGFLVQHPRQRIVHRHPLERVPGDGRMFGHTQDAYPDP